jgi:trimeric autotransporter adhesin
MERHSGGIYDAVSSRTVQQPMTSLRLVLLSIFVLVQGCGGGGGGSGGGDGDGGGGGGGTAPAPTAPGSFSASVRFDGATQRFVASWNASQGAARYRVQLKRDNVTDFAPLTGAENLSATILDFTFGVGFTVQWSAAAVRVEACNEVGCTPAADLPLLPHLAEALARKQILDVLSDANGLRIASSADGNTLVVGAPLEDGEDGQQRDKGVVYVFTRTGTTWNEQPMVLRAPNGEGGATSQLAGDHFGRVVALSADGATLAVGAPLEDGSRTSTVDNENDDAPDAGAVYIFGRNGATYELQTYLKPTPGAFDTFIADDRFGTSVALAAEGQTLVVGAPLAEGSIRPPGFDDGAAYVFTREAASWTQRALLGGPRADANSRDQFGRQVTISADGSTIAVGAHGDDEGVAESGAVYVFTTTDRLQWQREAYLKAPNAGLGDEFGVEVALSAAGNTLAIGAQNEDGDATGTLADDNENVEDAGAVYVYTHGDAGWSATPVYLKPSTPIEFAQFGRALSLTARGDQLAIGAPFDTSVPTLEGAAFVFMRVGPDWLEQARFDGTAGEFGSAIVLTPDGATLFVGAETSQSSPTAGVVHVH